MDYVMLERENSLKSEVYFDTPLRL